MSKKIIPYINAENEISGNVLRLAQKYENDGADEIFIYNYTEDEASREDFLLLLRELSKTIDIPFLAAASVSRFEDIKKVFYTGAAKVIVKVGNQRLSSVVQEGMDRFGKENILLEVDSNGDFENYKELQDWKGMGISSILLKHVVISPKLVENINACGMDVIVRDSLVRNSISELFSELPIVGISTNYYENSNILKAKRQLKQEGVDVNCFESSMSFSELKTDGNGLIPVVVQDYKSNEVLMVAYMNEEAFQKTVETGVMTYYSRSRQELWVKGETSGHYQYVKNLKIDCDNDTILAKVRQVGAACHTGNKSCFYRDLMKREYDSFNPFDVLSEDFAVIMDRKEHPKQGSYTNYLFDKGIDKILKKCGEEATEICIAAKNPEAEELKYEIADYLYHLMVLMAECNLTWEDVMKELANRR